MGTTAATVWNGDFGRSPFFGQLSGKQQLAYKINIAVSSAKRNGGSRN
jgi:hypothetical protein